MGGGQGAFFRKKAPCPPPMLPSPSLPPPKTLAMPAPKPSRRFGAFATFFVVYLIGVILFGAWVRITGSGAGCGSHWPTCHGEILPVSFSLEKKIEYTHRLTSGMCGIFGLVLVVWAWAKWRASRVFWGAVVTLGFVVFEGLIGAGIVLGELVAADASVARAVVISIHLVNTLFLTGAASLTAWWSLTPPAPPEFLGSPAPRWVSWGSMGALFGIAITSMAGAVTALGDTLFPKAPSHAGLLTQVGQEFSAAGHFLVELRIVHPVLALVCAMGLVAFCWAIVSFKPSRCGPRATRFAVGLMGLVGVQVVVGVVNVVLAAPGWIQLVHLGLAQLVWINALLLRVSALSFSRSLTSAPHAHSPHQHA